MLGVFRTIFFVLRSSPWSGAVLGFVTYDAVAYAVDVKPITIP